MITFDAAGMRFRYRVAGIAVHEGHVLLQQAEGFDCWLPPGGRCEIGEASADALAREMIEECAEAPYAPQPVRTAFPAGTGILRRAGARHPQAGRPAPQL